MRHSEEPIYVVEPNRISHEFESIFKTALAHESGDPGVPVNEKNRGSKISLYCPFKHRANACLALPIPVGVNIHGSVKVNVVDCMLHWFCIALHVS
jgi:hypothetical protein